MITIKLNLTLIYIVGKKVIELDVKCPVSLHELISKVGLTQSDIGMIIKNGRWTPMDCIVEENDVIQLFPHLEGG
ncbi:hypothetical protein [Sedimentibacter sp.]|uniref:hypothetical protein n=1 Tax=Sedimentibacter sp. TaxID=1960295 RepID=UPI0028A0CD00|nr:hypothetical protein [Sedimentibacter sp.]